MSQDSKRQLRELDSRLLDCLGERIELLKSLPTDSEHTAHLGEILGNSQLAERELVNFWLTHTTSLASRLAWKPVSVVYLGPIYSFSYLAAVKYFGLGCQFHPVATIGAAFEEIVRGQTSFAVVPIENSTDGRIVDTLSRFARTPVQICGEILLPVHHCLLARGERSEIVQVHSKPQALSQCRNWLAEHLPDAKLVEVPSTAVAAAAAAGDPSIGAIASREAGIHHGCRIIAENIEDNTQNVTRFAIIGNQANPPSGNDKTAVMFELSHQPGALADAMQVFKSAGVNLTWIESFPLPDRPSEYLFFVELDGHQQTPAVEHALQLLRDQTKRLSLLGSYPKGSEKQVAPPGQPA
jgi:chorismate mutase / prephenate dehydratase